MSSLALLIHFGNFLAPALWLAVCLPLTGRIFKQKGRLALSLKAQIAAQFVACSSVLGIGLAVFGRDGKMLTYLALLLVAAIVQLVISRR